MNDQNKAQNGGGRAAREFQTAWIEKNSAEWVGVRLSEFNGHKLVDVRVYLRVDGALRPTKRGISLRVSAIDELIELLTWVRDEAQHIGWFDSEPLATIDRQVAEGLAKNAIDRAQWSARQAKPRRQP